MGFAEVHAATFATRASGDVRGRVEIGLLRKAATRLPVVLNQEDQRERKACAAVMDGVTPSSWVTAVLVVLDINATLTNPTDAQVNTAVDTAWTYIIAARS